jgi:hypothetical protein
MSLLKTALQLALLLCLTTCLAGTASAYFVRYDYTANSEIYPSGSAYQTDSDYLYDQTYVEGHYVQPGYSEAGNYASLGFVADIGRGMVSAYTTAVGGMIDSYNIYVATARVEHIVMQDELIFVIPPGDYPDGLYARLEGRCVGGYSSTAGAGSQIQCDAWISNDIFQTGILEVGIGDSGDHWFDEEFTLLGRIVHPGAHYSIEVEVQVTVNASMHRCLNWAVEYNPGGGYITGSGHNDFCGGLQFTVFEPPEGITWWSASGVFMSGAVSVPEIAPAPEPMLGQNYPNPFNPTTTIDYQIPISGPVAIRVYSADGRLIRTLVDETRPAGHHSTTWDGRDHAGRPVATGVYCYSIQVDNRRETRRMILLN